MSQVFSCLVNGISYKLIAETCFISIDSVRKHFRNIYEKLHVYSKGEAVATAIKKNEAKILLVALLPHKAGKHKVKDPPTTIFIAHI
ncbi:MAG: response regulator transcription factor [Chitinophagales bacterium]